jgi:hypothetical protein
MHTYKMHVHKVHTCKVHAYEMHICVYLMNVHTEKGSDAILRGVPGFLPLGESTGLYRAYRWHSNISKSAYRSFS